MSVSVSPHRRRADRPPDERPAWWVCVPLVAALGLFVLLAGCEAQSWTIPYTAPDKTEENLAREREAEYVRRNVAAVKRIWRT